VFGSGREESRDWGAYIRSCIGPEAFAHTYLDFVATWDASDLAPMIGVPTLIVKHQGVQVVTMEMVKDLATLIPNAQFAIVQGTWADNPEVFARRMNAFVNSGVGDAPPAPELSSSGLTAILFADIVDSTALTERLGDASFRAKARDLDAALRAVIRDHSGTPIEGKLLGDGVLAVFTSARQAIEASLACARAADDAGLALHLGLHAGDVIREENNVYGAPVDTPPRIPGLSARADVLVPAIGRGVGPPLAGVRLRARGEGPLRRG